MQLLEIDAEFQALCPPLQAEERQQLEASLLAEGCREPLCVWWEQWEMVHCKNCDDDVPVHFGDGRWECDTCGYGVAPDVHLLLDGHNRYAICEQHGLVYDIREIELDTREEAVNWIIANQLGRRNLTPEQKSYLRGKRYNLPLKNLTIPKISMAQLAREYQVTAPTIAHDSQFAAAIDTLEAQVRQDIRDTILHRQLPSKERPTKEQVTRAGKLVQKQAVSPQPFMRRDGWKPYQVLEAIERLAALPEAEHAAVNRLLDGPFIPAKEGLSILENLAAMPDDTRQHLYGLHASPERRDHDLALALASKKAPPPDPQSQLAEGLILALQQSQQRLRRNWITAYPHDAWSDALRDLEADLLRIITRLTAIQAQVDTAHTERMVPYGATV